MIPRVKVLTDSSAGLSPDLARLWDIGVVPLYLTWGGQTYRDGIDLLPADFYPMLANQQTNPKTSAPNPADFANACRAAFAAGHQQVLIITVTPTLSTTYQNACLAAREIGSEAVGVLDCEQGAGAQALIAARAADIARSGVGLPAVLEAASVATRSTAVFLALHTLAYLRRGGRISGPQAMLGEAIQLKPILSFNAGRLQVVEKPRTMVQAIKRMVARLANDRRLVARALVMHAGVPEQAESLRDQIAPHLSGVEIAISPLSGIIGGHTGPGTLGYAVEWEETVA